MAKAVFITKSGSGYDDIREERYHFPSIYLSRVEQTVGDLIVYYEPRRNRGALSYVATGRVTAIVPDPKSGDHFYALVTDYLNFENPVPLRVGTVFFERSLHSEGQTGVSGNARSAVRIITEKEFVAITNAGFAELANEFVRDPAQDRRISTGFFEETVAFDVERDAVSRLMSRKFRDAAFSKLVKSAYEDRCAFTGLNMRNGGGRTEVDAAHIKPVGDHHRGPDSVRNGLAVSKTVHWMFDRGLISIDSDFKILKARTLVPEPISRLINPSGRLNLPQDEKLFPHAVFLDYHRNKIFKDAHE